MVCNNHIYYTIMGEISETGEINLEKQQNNSVV